MPRVVLGGIGLPNVALVARFKVKHGKADELMAAFRPLLEQVQREPGTLLYSLHRSKDDPDAFWTTELYADDDAFAAHAASDAMATATPALEELIAESDVLVGAPVAVRR
jgi:autoinducer 2-degrading protein